MKHLRPVRRISGTMLYGDKQAGPGVEQTSVALLVRKGEGLGAHGIERPAGT